ncbi:MAG TPA: hypothetical protein VFE47_05925 [Tepidisphaeraceae bacterium]|jgi:hypothetical protein|nr:hypothetical protein [Tepidisphaeraceae bacterium]
MPTSEPTSDPMEILLRHDKWATGQIIDACEKLAPAQFAQKCTPRAMNLIRRLIAQNR